MDTTLASTRMRLQKQVVVLHETIDPLVIDPGLSPAGKRSVDQGRDAAIAIGRALIDNRADQRQQDLVIGFDIRAT